MLASPSDEAVESRRGSWTAVVALLLFALGFAAGGAGSAWQTREARATPWRKLHVVHQGGEGQTTRTRIVFENPKLALQAVELVRDPDGRPEIARVALRDGQELTLRYDGDKRPTSIEGPDGARARLSYEKKRVMVAFFAPNGEEVGSQAVTVPTELRPVLGRARASHGDDGRLGVVDALPEIVREARADGAREADEQVNVERSVRVELELRGASDVAPGPVDVETTCPPLSCLTTPGSVEGPGRSSVRVGVSGSVKRSALGAPQKADLEEFKRAAVAERAVAKRVMPDVEAVVAAVGLTALACKGERVHGSICVADLAKAGAAGGVIHALATHEIEKKGKVIEERAEALWFEERARASLDNEVRVELCVAREGFARACATIAGRPFSADGMAPVAQALDLRKGIGGTLVGSFALVHADGADCKFAPVSRTAGPLKLTFDGDQGTVTATAKASERATRPNLGCSLGVANMSSSQSYTLSATQTFSKQELQSGGKLPLRLRGTMTGTGSYSFSNCRTSGGASVSCPAAKTESYSYPVEIVGEIDTSTEVGSGRIVVMNAPLPTNGTWRVPAEAP